MTESSNIFKRIVSGSLVVQIMVGIAAGIALATVAPEAAKSVSLLGSLFVKGLKAVAPILVFVIVAASIANQKKGAHTNMRSIISLYLIGTFMSALVAVTMSFPHADHPYPGCD
ncbi:cation:dicarboxylate symporter family transporter [Maridesulfovibrio sp.]|uniref:cation:dicarboxylate symporter family transporter n=1 Tax=Maridesulfovibrio sp. TaxID=2795000 RepID=UPI003B006054